MAIGCRTLAWPTGWRPATSFHGPFGIHWICRSYGKTSERPPHARVGAASRRRAALRLAILRLELLRSAYGVLHLGVAGRNFKNWHKASSPRVHAETGSCCYGLAVRGHHTGRAATALEHGGEATAGGGDAGARWQRLGGGARSGNPSRQLYSWRRQLRASLPAGFAPVRPLRSSFENSSGSIEGTSGASGEMRVHRS
jgi:hypothetical protein